MRERKRERTEDEGRIIKVAYRSLLSFCEQQKKRRKKKEEDHLNEQETKE